MKRAMFLGMLLGLCLRPVGGQLAITEVMSSASTNLGSGAVTNGPDFWELTNFDTTSANAINLAGYYYTDRADLPQQPLVQPGSAPLFIRPGESVLFVRTDTQTSATNEAQFRAWWGACLSTNVQVRMVPRNPGFNEVADGVRLYDPAGNLVDRVDFGIARRGASFVYDTNTTEFGVFSELGVCGTCQAAQADDLGSPGVTCGPVPLRILAQPASLSVCVGVDATFQVKAGGLPRPRYQWHFEDQPIPGAIAASLTVTNVQAANAGAYEVEVSNGTAVERSLAATLTVDSTPSAPMIVTRPSSPTVIVGETARFSVSVCALPSPVFQWHSNGLAIAGATNRNLVIANCALNMTGIEYCVRVQNTLGTTSACARLTVTPVPMLEITEVMPEAFAPCGHEDWFELTNGGTNAVDLFGYRFSDRFTFEGALVVTQSAVVLPGRSAVFAERLTAEEFTRWWGAERLPVGLPIIAYAGFGLSAYGDELYLWSPGAEDPFDVIASLAYSSATVGVSIEFDFEAFIERESVAGERGAFVAEECGDIASPGYTASPPPRFVSIARNGSSATLKWFGVPGRSYHLQWKNRLSDPDWMTLFVRTATEWVETATDAFGGGQRFYRLEEMP